MESTRVIIGESPFPERTPQQEEGGVNYLEGGECRLTGPY